MPSSDDWTAAFHGSVRSDEGRLTFHGEAIGKTNWAAWVLAWVAAGWLAGMVPAASAWMMLIFGARLLWGWTRPPWGFYEATPAALTAGGRAVPLGRIRIEGRQGQWQSVYVGEQLVLRVRPAGDAMDGVTVAGLSAFAIRLAELLGQDLRDQRNHALLQVWEDSADERARLRLAWDRDDARRRNPTLYAVDPVVPACTPDHDGGVFVVDGQGIRIDAHRVDKLDKRTIDEVVMLDDGVGRRLRLVARCGDRRVTIVETSATVVEAAQLLYLRDALAAQLGGAQGTAAEIPAGLVALQRR